MAVQVYGCNHVVIEVTDAKKAVKFYSDVFGLRSSITTLGGSKE